MSFFGSCLFLFLFIVVCTLRLDFKTVSANVIACCSQYRLSHFVAPLYVAPSTAPSNAKPTSELNFLNFKFRIRILGLAPLRDSLVGFALLGVVEGAT